MDTSDKLKRTVLMIPPLLWRDVKILAAQEGTSGSTMARRLLREGLARRESLPEKLSSGDLNQF